MSEVDIAIITCLGQGPEKSRSEKTEFLQKSEASVSIVLSYGLKARELIFWHPDSPRYHSAGGCKNGIVKNGLIG